MAGLKICGIEDQWWRKKYWSWVCFEPDSKSWQDLNGIGGLVDDNIKHVYLWYCRDSIFPVVVLGREVYTTLLVTKARRVGVGFALQDFW
jgi:hypothetical protein